VKHNIPPSSVIAGHRDQPLLRALADEVVQRAGGQNALAAGFSAMLRQCINDVIMTPKTGRRAYDELEKTEKTYIGTRVEIELRAMLHLPKGKLDTVILGHDVDIKHTMGSNWMIPTEAHGHSCLLVAADELHAKCYLGLIIADPAYLTQSENKDAKKTISAQGFENILWLLHAHPYPPNFWRTVPPEAVAQIFAGTSGNQRMANLFRAVQRRVIGRDVVQAVAQQRDFMRRIRSDNGKGTRDHLALEGIALLSGQYDAALIEALNLPPCGGSAFISFRPATRRQADLVAAHGITLGTVPDA